MKRKDIIGLVLCLALTGIIVMLVGCTTITPEELAAFKQKRDIIKAMSVKCQNEPVLCCPALQEAARAMETVVTACED